MGVRDKKIEGLADMNVAVLWSPWRGDDSILNGFSFRAGLTLPTGIASDQPLIGVAAPTVFQLGTGTVQMLLGAQYSGSVGEWSYSTRVDFTSPLHENDQEFRPAERYYLRASLDRTLTESVSAGVAAELSHGNRDEFHGMNIPTTGTTIISVRPSLVWRIDQDTAFSASVSIPVYREVNQTQITVGPLWSLGVSRGF